MKAIKYIAIASLLMLTVNSCTLEREEYSEIYPENFFLTETDLTLAVNALYYDFSPGLWGASSVYTADYNGYQTISDLSTDAGWCDWGWESDDLYYQQWTATVGLATQFWNCFSHYNYLSKARNTIRRIEASSVADNVKSVALGEAHALRGWMALYLYDMFGPVPVASDEILDDPETFVYLPRLTEEEYDELMETDLRAAIELLPEQPSARGRMSKGAARMILLKYYMIKGYFDRAETLARDLYGMEGSVYTLQPDYNHVFSKAGIGNNEIILQLPCNVSSTSAVNYVTAEVLPSDYPWGAEKGTGWGIGYLMPWAFYETYDAADIRRQNIKDSYVNTSGVTVDRSGRLAKGALPLKYGVDPDMNGGMSYIDLIIYRYSDVLLTLAECIVRNQGSPTVEAIDLVNRVRTRAGLPGLDATQTGSASAFLDALLLERGHEFYFEGLRRQDLIRFGKYVEYANQRINAANAADAGLGYFTVTDAHNRFPIPQSFIDESKSEIKQNPGY
ncbi:MAG: RagB/SusD family nutrient uptake outer membrane protein [Prevotellaceae bacterium]|jgi:hypothetical protein|nr:RagB/SusD family nutrient uptake outer membrane protein [Prevotellaceae bacterium]